MRKVLFFFLVLIIAPAARSNNIQVTNVSLIRELNSIKFDLSWENSWRSSILNNWDAAWVFVKYFDPQTKTWKPVKFTGINDIISANYDINRPGDDLGVFIYRHSAGSGTNIITDVQLGITPQQATGIYDLKVFAIEMVYIPEAAFYAGDGVSGQGYRTTLTFPSPGFNSGHPLNGIVDALCDNCNVLGSISGLSPAFPNGFKAFYYMKYELSQGGYRDFLNTLSYSQQVNHISVPPMSAPGTAALSNSARNYIEIKSPGSSSLHIPAVFGCDADGDNVYDEANDGEWVACNFLNWVDESAYLCWAGLRPVTELEYEKAARGIKTPVAEENAWGSVATSLGAYVLVNPSQNSEKVSVGVVFPGGNAIYSSTQAAPPYNGPLRNGIFATDTSSRTSSGGGFYGNMELSGNLWERVVTTARQQGQFFIGTHGNGMLNESGCASGFTDWPGYDNLTNSINGFVFATGLILRGGSWDSPYADLRISLRTASQLITDNNIQRLPGYGCRGGRTAP